MKQLITTLIVVALIAVGAYFIIQYVSTLGSGTKEEPEDQSVAIGITPPAEVPPVVEESVVPEAPAFEPETIIGSSVEGRDITAYHYGTGSTEILFIGGIHGGYSWNTSLVAYELMDYLAANPSVIPENVQVTVVPVLNPDGLYKTVGKEGKFAASDVTATLAESIPGRFNAHEVDLNRNFDCDWQASGTWQSRTVSGGAAAFSEPESQALKSYVDSHKPSAVVVYYSAVGGVFASNCHNGILPETSTLTNLYADASGYTAYQDFNFYEITGDAVNWLAKNNIPAISVLLTNHTDTEWSKNKAGVDAVLAHYAQ